MRYPFIFRYNRIMRTNRAWFWIIFSLYILIVWLYVLIILTTYKGDMLWPFVGLAAFIVVTSFPYIYWMRYAVFKMKKLYTRQKYKEIIEYSKKKPMIVFNQDLENIYIYLAVAHWTLKDEDQFHNYLNLVAIPRLFAIRDMWIMVDMLVNMRVFDAEEYLKTLITNCQFAKPIVLRKALPERMKSMIQIAKNKANKETYLKVFGQASNPRIIEYLNTFEEAYMS